MPQPKEQNSRLKVTEVYMYQTPVWTQITGDLVTMRGLRELEAEALVSG